MANDANQQDAGYAINQAALDIMSLAHWISVTYQQSKSQDVE